MANRSADYSGLGHACIKGGYKSIAIPETYSAKNIQDIYNNTYIDLTICDFTQKDIISLLNIDNLYYFNCKDNINNSFESIESAVLNDNKNENLIRDDYTIVFSSGTSEKVKKINWSFTKNEDKKSLKDRINLLFSIINYKLSFWSRRDNKVIIFMPFSHPVNRSIAMSALMQNVNIVISDPKNCYKHIITEKPNIMFAVPPVYEAISQNIKIRLEKFSGIRKVIFYLFNSLGINGLGNSNPIKRIFSVLLFKKIKKLYGGKADYFVTGSAQINTDVLKIFYSV